MTIGIFATFIAETTSHIFCLTGLRYSLTDCANCAFSHAQMASYFL